MATKKNKKPKIKNNKKKGTKSKKGFAAVIRNARRSIDNYLLQKNKFHGASDVYIDGNHIVREDAGSVSGGGYSVQKTYYLNDKRNAMRAVKALGSLPRCVTKDEKRKKLQKMLGGLDE